MSAKNPSTRYLKHLSLKDFGEQGQGRLKNASVLQIGAGGLGSASLLYLAAAGVGRIGVADDEAVELSNLQRQILYKSCDEGRTKVDCARLQLEALNPDVRVQTYQQRVTAVNIESLINEYDFIISGVDTFEAKLLINDACVLSSRPFSHASAMQYEGQIFTYVPGAGCLRCLFPDRLSLILQGPCKAEGILGPVAGIMGTLQATEVIKYFLGAGDLLANRFINFSALEMNFCEIRFKPNGACPLCGDLQ
ncbi:MAG: HesA/MoeB/ThiF family protein [Deltaproteobacteria bacterium]|nr:HesA/MoeB/ThiF family protein [Deltaproteobacteria bacterium]